MDDRNSPTSLGNADDPSRREQNRDIPVNEEQRTTAGAIRRLLRAVDRAGYDPYNEAAMQRFSNDLERMRQTAARAILRQKLWGQVLVGVITAGATVAIPWALGAVPWLTQWMTALLNHQTGHS